MPVTIVTLAQLFSWAIFILGDYLDERAAGTSGYALAASFLLPLLSAVLYLIFQKQIHDPSVKRWENVINVLGVWILETLLISALVFHLLKTDRWPIEQHTGGWENLLNGIEYWFFPLFSLLVPTALVGLWNLILLVWKRIRT